MRYTSRTRTWRGSPTDLADHARCHHLTQLRRALARDVAAGRVEPVEATGPAIEQGRAFEAATIARMRRAVEDVGGRFVDVRAAAGADPRQQRAVLAQAMRDGVELIAQAPLRAGSIAGYADLLERVDDADVTAGALGTVHRYEPVEIKYGRSVRPEYVLQACAYADALAALLGELPRTMHVVTGDGRRAALPVSRYVAYFRAARERFDVALATDLDPELARVPDPVPHCAGCDFRSRCDARREAADHLGLVAGIRSDQRAKLAAVDVTTLTQLATGDVEHVPGIGRSTLPRLHTQARLQLESRDLPKAEARIAWRDPDEDPRPVGRGFAMLPEPDPADVFFDFEGYPYHERGALEYLWGWTSRAADGALRFDHLWADDPTAEARAFGAFLDEVHARRERSPGMHVYHYAPYEVTALGRLAREHHHEQARLDALLRAGVFVDLYAVVRQAMQIGTPSYSIKSLEPLYGIDRSEDELADGGSSIEVYERWLAGRDESVRATILDYNRVDCESTLALRDWLLEQRERARADGIEWPVRPAVEAPPDDDEEEAGTAPDEDEADPAARTLIARLERVAADEERPDDVRRAARLLSAMPGWQRRVRREFFGDLYARMHERVEEDYVGEPTALAGLRLVDVEPRPKGTTLRTYSFPPQVTLLKAGQDAIDPTAVRTVGTVEDVDLDAGTITLRTTAVVQRRLDEAAAAAGEPAGLLPRVVVGWDRIPIDRLEPPARAVGEALLAALDAGDDPFAATHPGAAALSVLARRATRVVDGGPGAEALDHAPDPGRLADLVRRAAGSHVIVQGPPGTGKTWTSARLVVTLVEAGLTVGISSNSHDAVVNVLRGVDSHLDERAASGDPVDLRCAYALRTGEAAPGGFGFGEAWITRARSTAAAADLLASGDAQVLAGSAWQFARGVPLDVVLVDEAGQVSLLHATAMASSARRVVLVGDPQQLPQPSDAHHPFGCGASVLEHLFDGAAVLPPERAVLLPVTRRLHPDLCRFVSDTYYAGELTAHPDTAEQHVDAPGTGLPRTGIHLLPVEHAGNRSSAPEEVAAVADLVAKLLAHGRTVPRPGDAERRMTPADILVVAPYNAQRRLLVDALPEGVEIGTVDRFQGREAPVAILSMTASSRDELPRGLEFLLDPHRLNVGVSRARSLAVIAASPALLATDAANLHEMRLLNDLVRLAEVSGRVP